MGGVTGSSSNQSSSTAISPFQKKYLKGLYDTAQSQLLGNPLEYYGGQTVADVDPATSAYQSAALDYSQNGNAGLNQAGGYNADVLSGQYLSPDSNPYLRGSYDAAAKAVTDNYQNSVIPSITSRFALAGQGNSAGVIAARDRANQALGNSLGDLANNFYSGAYESERGRQEAARSFSPVFAEDEQNRLTAARDVGTQRETHAQSLLDALIQRFEFNQDEPYTRLSRYASILGNPITVSRGSASSKSFGINLGGALSSLRPATG